MIANASNEVIVFIILAVIIVVFVLLAAKQAVNVRHGGRLLGRGIVVH
jgi:hypothetical protein